MALRVVFMGTPDYGVPSLEALISAGYDVVGVFCQPDKPSGRGKRIAFCPVKQCALAHGIPVVQPVKTRVDGVEPLRALKPDLCVTAAFGHILSRRCWIFRALARSMCMLPFCPSIAAARRSTGR